jgi:hypothetical protein
LLGANFSVGRKKGLKTGFRHFLPRLKFPPSLPLKTASGFIEKSYSHIESHSGMSMFAMQQMYILYFSNNHKKLLSVARITS